MKEHDYAAAFAKIEKAKMSASSLTKADCLDDEYETIRHALRFAEKMMGEPTQEMVDAALYTQDIYTGRGSLARIGFEAMRDAALKGLGE